MFHIVMYVAGAILALIVLVPVVLLYLVAPLQMRQTLRRTADPQYHEFDPGMISGSSGEGLREAAAQLAKLGFKAVGHVCRTEESNGNSHVSVWTETQCGDIAQVIGTVAPTATRNVSIRSTLVTFRQEYADGTAIVTSNSGSPKVFQRDPAVDTLVCSGVGDLEVLYRVHRLRSEQRRVGRAPRVPVEGGAVSYMKRDWAKTFEAQVRLGLFRSCEDEDGQYFEPTLRGAFVMTWRLLWPLRRIHTAKREREADQALRSLGLGGLEELRAAAAGRGAATCLPMQSLGELTAAAWKEETGKAGNGTS